MRRLKPRTPVNEAAPPVATVPTPPAAAPPATFPTIPTPPRGTPVSPPAPPQLPSLTGGTLAQLGSYTPTAGMVLSGGGEFGKETVLCFAHESRNVTKEAQTQVGPLGIATPFVKLGEEFARVDGCSFTIIAEFPYWVTTAGPNYAPDRCWLSSKRGKDDRGNAYKERIFSVVLLLPGTSPLPEELRPALICFADWRGAECQGIKGHLTEVAKTTSPEWAKLNGQLAGAAPPRFRISSGFSPKAGTARGNGKAYGIVKNVSAPSNLSQVEAIGQWFAAEDCREELALVEEAFERECAKFRAMADETKADGH